MATTHRTFRADDPVWLPAKARAEREGRTMTDVLVAALIEYGQADKPTTKPAPRRSPGRADAKEK